MYGRAYLYKICITLFVVFNVACAVADSLGSLIVFRFLAGVVGSCPVTIGTGSIADMVPAEKRAGAMGAYVLGIVFGPSIGPIVGGYLAPTAGWRWCFWFMANASSVMAVVAVLFIEESYPYVLLKRKTERSRRETGIVDLRSAICARHWQDSRRLVRILHTATAKDAAVSNRLLTLALSSYCIQLPLSMLHHLRSRLRRTVRLQ